MNDDGVTEIAVSDPATPSEDRENKAGRVYFLSGKDREGLNVLKAPEGQVRFGARVMPADAGARVLAVTGVMADAPGTLVVNLYSPKPGGILNSFRLAQRPDSALGVFGDAGGPIAISLGGASGDAHYFALLDAYSSCREHNECGRIDVITLSDGKSVATSQGQRSGERHGEIAGGGEDIDGDMIGELAVLSRSPDGKGVIKLLSGRTLAVIKTIPYPSEVNPLNCGQLVVEPSTASGASLLVTDVDPLTSVIWKVPLDSSRPYRLGRSLDIVGRDLTLSAASVGGGGVLLICAPQADTSVPRAWVRSIGNGTDTLSFGGFYVNKAHPVIQALSKSEDLGLRTHGIPDSELSDSHFGVSACWVGDLTADGVRDIAIGAASPRSNSYSSTWLFDGRSGEVLDVLHSRDRRIRSAVR